MKRLKPFAYFQPATLAEASKILLDQGSGAYLLAGGTDLLVRLKKGEINATALINLKSIDGLGLIEPAGERGLQIGALTTISSLGQSSLVRSAYPVLAEAAGVVGSPSIRNLATLGGNIWRASPASDLAPALMVLMAQLFAVGPEGKREFPLESIFYRRRQQLRHRRSLSCVYGESRHWSRCSEPPVSSHSRRRARLRWPEGSSIDHLKPR